MFNELTGEEVVPLSGEHTPMPETATDLPLVVQVKLQSAFPVGGRESPPGAVQVV